MSIAGEVQKRIKEMKVGEIISYKTFTDLGNKGAVALALSRLCKQKKISRLQKGKYYKPLKTEFGELQPSETQIVNELLEENAYVTGAPIYNSLGLTTQVPNDITIKGKKYSRKTKVGNLNIRYVKDVNRISKSSSEELLQILDAFKNIKRIPDADITKTFKRLAVIVEQLNEKEQISLSKLALKYKPSVRALVGAILENINESLAQKLQESLNPLSVYKIGLNKNAADNLKKWRIQ